MGGWVVGRVGLLLGVLWVGKVFWWMGGRIGG